MNNQLLFANTFKEKVFIDFLLTTDRKREGKKTNFNVLTRINVCTFCLLDPILFFDSFINAI